MIRSILLFMASLFWGGVLYQNSYANEVKYIWSGAITPTSAKVHAKLLMASNNVKLLVSENPSFNTYLSGNSVIASIANNLMAAMYIDNLIPSTKYYYAVNIDGITDPLPEHTGTFTTPAATAFSFRFTIGSCNLHSNHPVFNRIAEKNPLFQLVAGDFHYDNPNSASDINVHRMPYENNMLSQTASKNFFRHTPLVYIWDDHDFSGNDSDGSAMGKLNARQAYQEYVPHYPLAAGVGNVPIYQAFTIGRIRFILSDLRSERGSNSMMGITQKNWFKNELLTATSNHQLIAWVSSVSFGGTQADNWGGFAAERMEISNFLKDNNISNLFILSGDAHMLAIDNGNNHDFSTSNNNPQKYPVFQAGALNQNGSFKGGAYSEGGAFLNPDNSFGQYGLIEINDNGSSNICVQFTGWRVDATGTTEVLLNNYSFCRTLQNALPMILTNFHVQLEKQHCKISFTVQETADGKYYEIEKSTDGITFKKIHQIKSSNNLALMHYSYDDDSLISGDQFYRIKFTDKENHTEYSAVKKIFNPFNTQKIFIISNTNSDNLQIKILHTENATPLDYTIYTLSGQAMKTGKAVLHNGNNYLSVPAHSFSPGIYFIKIQMNHDQFIEKFIQQ